MWCSLISLPTGAELYLSRPVCSQWCHGWRWLVFYLSMPSHDQFRGVTERAPAWMLKVTVPSFSQSTRGIVTQRGPSPALHPFLPCCSSVAWKPELNIGPHSPNFPSSSSKAFLSSSLHFLSPLSPSPSSHSSPCLSFSFPLPIPHGGDFRDFGWRNGKHSPEQRKLLLSKAISTMSHLMTQWRSLLGGCVCVCVYTLVTRRVRAVPSVHSFSLEHPLVQRALPQTLLLTRTVPPLLWNYEPRLRVFFCFVFPPYYQTNYIMTEGGDL